AGFHPCRWDHPPWWCRRPSAGWGGGRPVAAGARSSTAPDCRYAWTWRCSRSRYRRGRGPFCTAGANLPAPSKRNRPRAPQRCGGIRTGIAARRACYRLVENTAANSTMTGIQKVIGLMSGTSLDGVDAALLDTDGEGVARPGPSLTVAYDRDTRDLLR